MALHFDEHRHTINPIIQIVGRTNFGGSPSTYPRMDQDWARQSRIEDLMTLLDRLDDVVRELHQEVVSDGAEPLSGSPPEAAPWSRDSD